MKHWSGSRPSTWQKCWTCVTVFSGWIRATSPAAKLDGKATAAVGVEGGWGSRAQQRAEPASREGWGLCSTLPTACSGFGGGPRTQTVALMPWPCPPRSLARTRPPAWCLKPFSPDPRPGDVELDETNILEV